MTGVEKNGLLLSMSLALLLLSGCGIDNTDENIVGENLLIDAETFNPEVNLSQAQIQAGLDAQGNGQTALLGIKSYKISYMTTDEDGKKVRASGLVSIPDISAAFMQGYKAKTGRNFSLSIVSDQHGTIFTNAQAPSVHASATHMPDALATAYSAVAGFMTVQPDYLGYGDSNTTHPYILEKPSANTTVDMIKAAITFANKAGLPINGQVFLSGYSEGGYATMAAAKEIQANHPDIHLMAVAPMAGPYDVEKLGVGTLSADIMAFPPFLADIAYSYTKTYDDVKIDSLFNAPYASTIPTLFDGEHNGSVIYYSLPNALSGNIADQATDKLFVPSFSDDFISNSENSLRKHFRENSVIDWTPKMPMHMYHCSNDAIIPFSMSTLAQESFTQKGSTTTSVVRIDTIPDSQNPLDVHAQCATAAYAQAIPWFDKIRKGEK
jgi:predicted esterase